MHNADPDMARGLMKNMAEMALYDSELAGGDEVYLPSDGSFPSADKMRVDRDGKGVVEKVAGVSVKFGKNGAVYGFPGESSQYQKFHPDEDKRTHMRNRVGHKGHALGVRDDLIQNKSKFNKMLKESGLSETIKNPEVVRTKLLEIQEKINKLRLHLLILNHIKPSLPYFSLNLLPYQGLHCASLSPYQNNFVQQQLFVLLVSYY